MAEKKQKEVEQKVEAKEDVGLVALNKKVNDLEAKLRRYGANWKAFCDKYLGVDANDGKLGAVRHSLIVGLSMVFIATLAFAATTIVDRKIGPEGAAWSFQDVTGVGTVTVSGGEGDNAELILDADEGDDNADTWTFTSTASGNSLTVKNHTTTCLTLTSAGNATFAGTVTASGSGGTLDGVTLTNVTTLAASASIKGGTSGVITNVAIHGSTIGAVNPTTGAFTTVDADSYTVNAGAGLDCQAAGALQVGITTATSVDIGKTLLPTTVKGTFNVDEAATFDTTLGVTGAATLSGGGSLAGGFTLTNALTGLDSSAIVSNVVINGSAIGGVNPAAGAFTTVSASADITANGNISGDNDTLITGVSNVTLVAGAELTVDGKYAAVGPDATTGLMILKGTFTNGQATVTFGTVFGAAPAVVCGWTDDTSGIVETNCAVSATSITASNFVPKAAVAVGDLTNANYIAVGSRP